MQNAGVDPSLIMLAPACKYTSNLQHNLISRNLPLKVLLVLVASELLHAAEAAGLQTGEHKAPSPPHTHTHPPPPPPQPDFQDG